MLWFRFLFSMFSNRPVCTHQNIRSGSVASLTPSHTIVRIPGSSQFVVLELCTGIIFLHRTFRNCPVSSQTSRSALSSSGSASSNGGEEEGMNDESVSVRFPSSRALCGTNPEPWDCWLGECCRAPSTDCGSRGDQLPSGVERSTPPSRG